MARFLFPVLIYVVAALSMGCIDKQALAESSFGKKEQTKAKASATSVISMGRDDDDGKAKKWHIGGGTE